MSSMHMLFAVSECEFVFVYVCFEILPDPCFMRRAMPARAMTAAAPNQLTPNVARRYVMLPPHRSFTTSTLFLCPPFSFMCGANPHHLQKQKKHPLSEWARTAGRTEGRTGTSLEISWQAARRRGTRSDTLAHLHLPIDTHTSPRSSDSLHRIVYQEPREGKGGSSSNSTQSPMQHTQTADFSAGRTTDGSVLHCIAVQGDEILRACTMCRAIVLKDEMYNCRYCYQNPICREHWPVKKKNKA